MAPVAQVENSPTSPFDSALSRRRRVTAFSTGLPLEILEALSQTEEMIGGGVGDEEALDNTLLRSSRRKLREKLLNDDDGTKTKTEFEDAILCEDKFVLHVGDHGLSQAELDRLMEPALVDWDCHATQADSALLRVRRMRALEGDLLAEDRASE
mmetsp:Transcript_45675/g.106023  ORF Transcript_45675/g.106023 Transcript_45675/m.106023 type:complete len:154 (-) Transcript_45675:79-540(-)